MNNSDEAQKTSSVTKSNNFVEGSSWLPRLKRLEQTARGFMSDPKYTDEEKKEVEKELLTYFKAGEVAFTWRGYPLTSSPTETDCSRLPTLPTKTKTELENSEILLPSNRKKESQVTSMDYK